MYHNGKSYETQKPEGDVLLEQLRDIERKLEKASTDIKGATQTRQHRLVTEALVEHAAQSGVSAAVTKSATDLAKKMAALARAADRHQRLQEEAEASHEQNGVPLEELAKITDPSKEDNAVLESGVCDEKPEDEKKQEGEKQEDEKQEESGDYDADMTQEKTVDTSSASNEQPTGNSEAATIEDKAKGTSSGSNEPPVITCSKCGVFGSARKGSVTRHEKTCTGVASNKRRREAPASSKVKKARVEKETIDEPCEAKMAETVSIEPTVPASLPAKFVRDLVLADLTPKQRELAISVDGLIEKEELPPVVWSDFKVSVLYHDDAPSDCLEKLWECTNVVFLKRIARVADVSYTPSDKGFEAVQRKWSRLRIARELCLHHVARYNSLVEVAQSGGLLYPGSVIKATLPQGCVRGIVKYPTVWLEFEPHWGSNELVQFPAYALLSGGRGVKHSDVKQILYAAPGAMTVVDPVVASEKFGLELKEDRVMCKLTALDALKAHGVAECDVDTTQVSVVAEKYFADQLVCLVMQALKEGRSY